ncbi:MAG: hypothetical protein WEA76_04215 [Acidimicrobiia bacterium]
MRFRQVKIILALAAFPLLAAMPALGSVTPPCNGSVTIGGATYGPDNDTAGNPIVIPADKSGVVAVWTATTGTPITDHSGSVGIVVGPSTVELASWNGENADLETTVEGDFSLASAPSFLQSLTGLYEVTATHSGNGGSCDGSVMVKLEGNAATTPVGAASIGGTVAAALGLAFAGRGKAV